MKIEETRNYVINKAINQVIDTFIFLSCIFTVIVVYTLQGITFFNFIIYIIAYLTMNRYYCIYKQIKEENKE